MADDDPIVVFLTAASGEEATRLADLLIGAHLAACVQILPEMESVYRWQGQIERQSEILLIVKTTAGKFAELETEVRALHSYETPEIVAVPIVAGSQPYLDWVSESVKPQLGMRMSSETNLSNSSSES
ncbi:MAG TPA: divalent-cation tolerance protein CutA [Pyrinomonadaceae bacterium]|jgi:periplasmic divalent cation tolerance protein|nr:divalent-cation tolerance protein CutA [Pyrinomonadaceae bacterium]